jgi:RNA polymerase sigma-70 factor (ECF subfamily)
LSPPGGTSAAFAAKSRFSTWLFALARNACIDRARRSRRRPLVGLPEQASELAALEPSAGAVDVAEVFAAARALSLPLRQALLLRDLQGLSYEEIAALQDVPLGTVRSRIASARAMLAEALRL